jgi:UDP-N-acetylmuramoyl-L-alanyl-D-glutamate--2,6-diaminopimelate ligase
MNLIGITGTNGKTTTSTLIYKYFRYNNIGATLIGTNGIYINDEYIESINTTPGIDIIYKVLQKSYESGIKYVIIEISSHAIKQKRIHGLKFKLKALTNITEDHLDFHKTMKDYAKTKLYFLRKGTVLINNDLVENYLIKRSIIRKVYSYGKNNSDYAINKIKQQDKTTFSIIIKEKEYLFKTNLQGEFNLYNITLFIGVLDILNKFDYKLIKKFLDCEIQIPGRMKFINYIDKKVIIDYAHTPDAMEKVLVYASKHYSNIITLFGCGGDRDKSKRRIMGLIAESYADLVVLTEDNTRSENLPDIINDIMQDMTNTPKIIYSRRDAIEYAINMANSNDIVLVLGKGGEKYIEKGGYKYPFSDEDEVRRVLLHKE